MEKVIYRSRLILRRIYWSIFAGLILFELLFVRVHIQELSTGTLVEALIKIFVATSVVILTLIRMHFMLRPRIFSEYQIEDGKILIYFKSKIKEIEVSQISQVKFSLFSPRFFGGFSIYLKSGQKFYFLSLLVGADRILSHIFNLKPDLFEEKKYQKFLFVLQMVEDSWQRVFSSFKSPLFYIKYFLLPILVYTILIFNNCNKNAVLVMFSAGLIILISLGLNSLREKWILTKSEVNSEFHKIPPEELKKVYLVFDGIYFIIFLLISIGLLNFNCF